MDTPSIISELFEKQKKRSQELRNTPLQSRKQKLKALRHWIYTQRDDIQAAVYQDMAKPASEVDVTEIYPVLAEAWSAIRHLKSWAAPEPVNGSLTFLGTSAYVHYEPKGTSLVISPWNYPLLLAIGPIISSIAAGNTIILKPSEFTPAVNGVIRTMIGELFAEEEVAMLEGDAAVATDLLKLPFDHIFFTGSPAVGKIVMEAAAKNLTSVTLELGGKSPTIVDETADELDAARKIAWGKWTNAGQTCVAPDYVFVHRSKMTSLLRALELHAEKGYSNKASYTSIINERHFDRLSSCLSDAVDKGAKVEFGGEMHRASCTISPTVLTETTDEMLLMKEEIFGPLLPIRAYDQLEEVIRFINERPKPLALYLYTRSKKNRMRILSETSSGAVVFNDNVLQFGHPHLPMGGVNNSGIGKAHGRAGFLAFSHGKAVLRQRVGFTIAGTVYPPYSRLKKKLIEWMLKYF